MWYVIQTQSGREHDLKELLDHMRQESDLPVFRNCFIPLYEDVYRRGGVGHISIKRMFPGYLFVETEDPDSLFALLKTIPEFTRLLGMEERNGEKVFIPVREDEKAFLSSILENGLMHVSFLRRAKSGRIEQIVGPLAQFGDRITKLDVPHRRAIVEAKLFGKVRRVKFSLWTDVDTPLPWLDEKRGRSPAATLHEIKDIGIHEGDQIVDETGVYGDQIFTVSEVDLLRRLIRVEAQLFGIRVPIEMRADDVRRV